MLICTFYLICFFSTIRGPDLEGGGAHAHNDVRQDEEEPCNHFIAFTLFALFFIFQHFVPPDHLGVVFCVLQTTAYLCCKSLHICVANGVSNHHYIKFFQISIFHHATVAERTGVGGGGQNVSPPELGQPPAPLIHLHVCFFCPPSLFFCNHAPTML
jgi:hypothetical protein